MIRRLSIRFAVPVGIVLTLPFLLGGCASLLDTIFQSASDRAGQMVGNAIGERVGSAIAGQTMLAMNQLTPELTQAYAMGVFATVYYQGGFYWEGKPYTPGQFTQWEGRNTVQGDFFEKAFLKREANKQEWWRVRVVETENGKTEEAVFEALFSAPTKSGEQKILRMRAKLPGQAKGAEVPITAKNQESWVLRPAQALTPESLKGATVGTEQVGVPAGTYKARHVRFASGNGQVDWWIADGVPGGVVKYSFTATDEDSRETETATMQLKKAGSGAKPTLL
jgi:hypothetical protein